MGKLHVVSHDHMRFSNRQQADDCLADLLLPYRGGDTIVVGIPRGGVVLADHYRHFPAVDDAGVLAALKRHFDRDLLEGTSFRKDDGDAGQ